jgi:hypothetical protein
VIQSAGFPFFHDDRSLPRAGAYEGLYQMEDNVNERTGTGAEHTVNLFSPFVYAMRALAVGRELTRSIRDLFWPMVKGDFGQPASKNKRYFHLFLLAG